MAGRPMGRGCSLLFFLAHRHKSPEWREQEAQRRFANLAAEIAVQAEDETGALYPNIPNRSLEEHPGSVLRYRLPDDPESKQTLWGLLLFCVLWNGVVSVFVVIAIHGLLQGKPEWGLMLFLIPFVLIGLVVFVVVVRDLLIRLGVGPTAVEINAHPLRPGQAAEILATQGGRSSMNALDVSLVCEEVATYREGTDTRTETQRVFAEPLFQREGFEIHQEAPFEARCTLRVPEGAMHSFEAGSNKVVWKVVVKGDVASWPDFERAFPLVVLPEAPKGAIA